MTRSIFVPRGVLVASGFSLGKGWTLYVKCPCGCGCTITEAETSCEPCPRALWAYGLRCAMAEFVARRGGRWWVFAETCKLLLAVAAGVVLGRTI